MSGAVLAAKPFALAICVSGHRLVHDLADGDRAEYKFDFRQVVQEQKEDAQGLVKPTRSHQHLLPGSEHRCRIWSWNSKMTRVGDEGEVVYGTVGPWGVEKQHAYFA